MLQYYRIAVMLWYNRDTGCAPSAELKGDSSDLLVYLYQYKSDPSVLAAKLHRTCLLLPLLKGTKGENTIKRGQGLQ